MLTVVGIETVAVLLEQSLCHSSSFSRVVTQGTLAGKSSKAAEETHVGNVYSASYLQISTRFFLPSLHYYSTRIHVYVIFQ